MEQVIENLGVDLRMMLFSTINFLIVLFILNKFLFGRIGRFLRERQAEIEQSLQNAEQVKIELAEAEVTKTKIIADAGVKANTIVSTAEDTANTIVTDARNKAKNDVEHLHAEAQRKIENERNEMIKELKTKTADLAIMATEKILDQKLDEEKDKQIISKYLDTLDA